MSSLSVFVTAVLARCRRGGHERGDSLVEMILVLPVFGGMFFAIVQGAIWADARNLATAAANTAYSNARAYDGTTTGATDAGYQFLETSGRNLDGAVVTVNKTATTVTATVTGHSLTLIPGWFGTDITRTVTGPVERWVD